MKVNIYQFQNLTSFDLIPETLEESSQLLRFTLNSKKEKPFQLYYNLSDEPKTTIEFLMVNKNIEKRFLEK